MFILIKPIKGAGDEPFLPPPPYNPKTGEDLPGVPFHHTLVRPQIRKGEKGVIPRLEEMDIGELEKFIGNMSKKDLEKLVKELLERIKKQN